MVLGVALGACRARDEQALAKGGGPPVGQGIASSIDAGVRGAVQPPRTHARSHVLLGIDFSRRLTLPACTRFYDSFDRPDRTCVYLRSVDHKPFKIEFQNGVVPSFLKWSNALVSTDGRGRPQLLRFDVTDDPALRGKAVDAMLDTFGPPTRVENARGASKVGTWQHSDYVIQYVFDAGGGGTVQMETKAFHDMAGRDAASRSSLASDRP